MASPRPDRPSGDRIRRGLVLPWGWVVAVVVAAAFFAWLVFAVWL